MSRICWPSALDVSYETIRRWVLKFGPLFARELRRRCHRPTSQWHLDEMAILIGGRRFWLWRAVDEEGEVLDLLVQRRRDARAAAKLMRKLLRKQGFAPKTLAPVLWGSQDATGLVGSPRARPAEEQPGREFASAGATTRAEDAAF
jgi:transposase-like protein